MWVPFTLRSSIIAELRNMHVVNLVRAKGGIHAVSLYAYTKMTTESNFGSRTTTLAGAGGLNGRGNLYARYIQTLSSLGSPGTQSLGSQHCQTTACTNRLMQHLQHCNLCSDLTLTKGSHFDSVCSLLLRRRFARARSAALSQRHVWI